MAILTLDRMLRTHAAERGEKPALRDVSTSLSYAVLERRARQVAQGLLASGIGSGDRVCYLGKNTLAYFEYLLGAAKVGAVTVPINWRLAPPELAHIVQNSRPRLALVEEPFETLAATAAADIRRLVTGGSADTFAAWRDGQSDQDVPGTADWNQPLLQMYTSGTTGRAKGAVLTHRNLFALRARQTAIPAWFAWSADDVSLIAMPAAHVSGTGWAVWTLQHGATGIVAREFDPHAVLEQILQYRINKVMMVPSRVSFFMGSPI